MAIRITKSAEKAIGTKKPRANKLALVSPLDVTLPSPELQALMLASPTELMEKAELKLIAASQVTMTLALKSESKAYLEIELDGRQAWLTKASLLGWSAGDGEVGVTMTAAYARRRGLLAA